MITLEKLQEALQHMQEAKRLVNEASKENHSLDKYYGYSLQIISQELIIFSDNSAGYLGRNTNLQEIVDAERKDWRSKEISLKRKRRNTENTPSEKTIQTRRSKRH